MSRLQSDFRCEPRGRTLSSPGQNGVSRPWWRGVPAYPCNPCRDRKNLQVLLSRNADKASASNYHSRTLFRDSGSIDNRRIGRSLVRLRAYFGFFGPAGISQVCRRTFPDGAGELATIEGNPQLRSRTVSPTDSELCGRLVAGRGTPCRCLYRSEHSLPTSRSPTVVPGRTRITCLTSTPASSR